jgi:hypothetical protein
MEIKIFLSSRTFLKKGKWFLLPSYEAMQLEKEILERGEEPIISEINSDIDLGDLTMGKTVMELNHLVGQLWALPPKVLENLSLLRKYESLESIIESAGSHFVFREGTRLKAVAKELVKSGEIENYMLGERLYDYLDYEALGKNLSTLRPFFAAKDGSYIEYEGGGN